MIVGIGIDIIEINRIEKALMKAAFKERIFTEAERAYLKERNYNTSTASGIFAAKEAISKALATGIGRVGWKDIEILRDDSGKPLACLKNEAKNVLKDLGGDRIFLSISHSKEYAIAQAIITKG